MKDVSMSTSDGIWRRLWMTCAAVGALTGLTEVCWCYLLPTIFPERRYALPTSGLTRFVVTAVTVDVILAFVGGVGLFILFWLVRAAVPRARSWRGWPGLTRTLLLAGAAEYFFVCQVRLSALMISEQGSIVSTALLGGAVILPLAAGVMWGLGRLERRGGPFVPKAAWTVVGLAILSVTFFNYSRYRITQITEMQLPQASAEHRPNMLLITLDTVRADILGCYGDPVVKTPTLDGLAADGVLFESAFAQASSTTPSHCSLMTSTYAAQHGGVNGVAMRHDLPTLAQILRHNGYATSAFVAATTVRSTDSGLHRGFDLYDDSMVPWSSFFRHDECQFLIAFYFVGWWQHNQVPANVVTERALKWLGRSTDSPFFVWLHYFDPHTPYAAPGDYKDMYVGKVSPDHPYAERRARYGGEVTYVDVQLGRVIDDLKARNLYNDMLIMVTADHGESLGERHGDIQEFGHGHLLYDTTQRVPLIVKLPGNQGAGRRVQDLVQLLDLAPTVLDMLGAPYPKSFEGRTLSDLLAGQARAEPGVAYAECPPMPVAAASSEDVAKKHLVSMRTPQIKFISNALGERQELYDLLKDPAETTNIYLDHFDLADACHDSIIKTLGEQTSDQAQIIDPKVIEQLRALGYIDETDEAGQDEEKQAP